MQYWYAYYKQRQAGSQGQGLDQIASSMPQGQGSPTSGPI